MVGSHDFYRFHNRYARVGEQGKTRPQKEVEEIYFPCDAFLEP